MRRPPTRANVEQWIKARRILAEEKNQKEQKEEEKTFELRKALGQTRQHFKVRVRRKSDDSFGSELTCSPPSSPDGSTGLVDNTIDNGGDGEAGRSLGLSGFCLNPLVLRVQKIKICNLTLNRLLIVEFVKKMVYIGARQGLMG